MHGPQDDSKIRAPAEIRVDNPPFSDNNLNMFAEPGEITKLTSG